MTLWIDDVWQHEGFRKKLDSLLLSRSDRRIGGTNVSQIVKFYVCVGVGARGGSVRVMAGTPFLEHAPVILFLAEEVHRFSQAIRILESLL